MKKVIMIILAALFAFITIYNTYKVLSIKKDNSQHFEKEITKLKEENNTLTSEIKSLTEEINKLKISVEDNKKNISDVNEKISSYNYKNDITNLKNKTTKLENVEKALIECLIYRVSGNMVIFNLSGKTTFNSTYCQNLINNHKDYIKYVE